MRLHFALQWAFHTTGFRRQCGSLHTIRYLHSATKHLKEPARTRFAPSPTGNLHLGSIRTALFNYLIARRTGGQFLLRIEDTDRKRTVPGAEERLFDDLQWAGISWDEGPVVGGPFGPYRQSERQDTYRAHSVELLVSGAAYRCFCSSERLDTLARARNDKGLTPGYDRKCYDMSQEESDSRAYSGEQHVVRLRAPVDYPQFQDVVYGKTGKGPTSKRELYLDDVAYDDPIMMKSDGFPTYHFANVVDDHLMKITHVIRGSEWMSSTPLHMAIYEAFGWQAPNFAHVALLVDPSGQKLSKRDKASDISFYRSLDGVFPDTLLNFAALLGWSHQRKSDVMCLHELERDFTFKFTKGNATVAFEKLWFLQQRHAQRYIKGGGPRFAQMVDAVKNIALDTYPNSAFFSPLSPFEQTEIIAKLLRADGKNYSTPKSFVEQNATVFVFPSRLPPYTRLETSIALTSLRTAAAALTLVPSSEWNSATHSANISALSSLENMETDTQPNSGPLTDSTKSFRKELYHYMRWALLGGSPGPGISDTMTLLGKEEATGRIKKAIEVTLGMEQEGKVKGGAGRPKIEPLKVNEWKDLGS